MLDKAYDPKLVEEKLSQKWQEKGAFKVVLPEDRTKKTFVIVIPPPNITGALHVGHALNDTLQDALVRAQWMFGKSAYWVPGIDHGGIATQNVMEKALAKDRHIKRQDLGREKFIEELWKWYGECGYTILHQLKKLGTSLDLNPENIRFTMDKTRAGSVFAAFSKLWAKKYIYRGKRMINWCVRCSTALSDIEVEHTEHKGKLWHINYPFADGSGHITIATTRPETMLGDIAVAVNPKDERYKSVVGKELKLPLTDRTIKIIADSEVDISFGTGAVKITPAHDQADYEMGKRHNLEAIAVIADDGKMINVPEKYLGMDRAKARTEVAADLKEAGFLEKEEPYCNSVSTCYRCSQPIEPYISEQWFVKMDNLAKPAIEATKKGKVKLHPMSWEKPYLAWLENLEDWCISRQIWWGHRIPVWYCKKCSAKGLMFDVNGELSKVSFEDGAQPFVSEHKPEQCPGCKGHDFVQDPDVLDTWFSSALWPFSVFGWPEKTEELSYYYPTTVLVTGYEILYLWVARMVMMGLEFMNDIPFKDVYVHGIVRDKHGKKMSKSLGNVVNPLDLMDKYGTDALRFSLLAQAFPGKDIPFGEESIVGARNFCNKIHNAARFVHRQLPQEPKVLKLPAEFKHLSDRWILDRMACSVRDAKLDIDNYDVAGAAVGLYSFFWSMYCDWYIELAKLRLEDEKEKDTVLAVLVHVLYNTLKALHPLMPFITEELASYFRPYLGLEGEFLMHEPYPLDTDGKYDEMAALAMDVIMGVTTEIRTVRSHFNIAPSVQINAIVSATAGETLKPLQNHPDYVKFLAKLNNLELGVDLEKPKHCATAVFRSLSIYIPLEGLIDFELEKERLNKEHAKIAKELETCKARLDDPKFVERAPKEQVDTVKARLNEASHKLEQLTKSIADLS